MRTKLFVWSAFLPVTATHLAGRRPVQDDQCISWASLIRRPEDYGLLAGVAAYRPDALRRLPRFGIKGGTGGRWAMEAGNGTL